MALSQHATVQDVQANRLVVVSLLVLSTVEQSLSPGPEQPVCLTAKDLGVQVLQSGGCKMVESRRVTTDPTSGTPDAGKPMQLPEMRHPNTNRGEVDAGDS